MPPSRKIEINRDQSDMTVEGALHITQEQASVFAAKTERMKIEDANVLREKAAEADRLREQLTQALSKQGGADGLLVQEDGSLIVQGFQFSPTGLIAPDEINQQSWQQVGELLFRLEGSIQWLIGDWLVYGASQWGDATAIAEKLGYEANTLWSYASVCRAIQPLIRIKELSFAHHRLVMKLSTEGQAEALAYAAEHSLTVAAFRKILNNEQPATSAALPSGNERGTDEPRYHTTKILESIEATALGDWRKIPARERQSKIDDIDLLQQRLDKLKKWYREGPDA